MLIPFPGIFSLHNSKLICFHLHKYMLCWTCCWVLWATLCRLLFTWNTSCHIEPEDFIRTQNLMRSISTRSTVMRSTCLEINSHQIRSILMRSISTRSTVMRSTCHQINSQKINLPQNQCNKKEAWNTCSKHQVQFDILWHLDNH